MARKACALRASHGLLHLSPGPSPGREGVAAHRRIEHPTNTNRTPNTDRKPSSDRRNSSDRKSSPDRRPSSDRKPSPERKPRSDRKPSPDRKTSSDRKTSLDRRPSSDRKPFLRLCVSLSCGSVSPFPRGGASRDVDNHGEPEGRKPESHTKILTKGGLPPEAVTSFPYRGRLG